MAKVIMVQGTMSNAGKSIITAGLCRIFKEDGYKVAPFKAQNMALNSFITKDGLEMGRAQVVQAEASGIEPSVYMNPILLKPTNDKASQVIVNGEVWKNLSAKEYYANKHVLVPEIEKAYKKLDEEYDIIVMEGAGSPAEINLKDNDIVNMFMAKLVNAPVLLVGDIDRGGVFASLVGTLTLFDEEERNLVAGLVINKFRGDLEILRPGLKMLEDKTGKSVLGVVPYLDIDIDDEDSLSDRMKVKNSRGIVNIAVIRTPRISNFTDFKVFDAFDGVNVKYITSKDELDEKEDMIILPGTKNTMEDLKWIRQNGIEAKIKKLASRGTPIFAICGGYQMLGKTLKDPYNVESGGEITGMELLDTNTIFERSKVRTLVNGRFERIEGIFSELTGKEIEGYEIHMGVTEIEDGNRLASIESMLGDKKIDGVNKNNIYGTYIHGIFDKSEVVSTIVKALMNKKGIDNEKDFFIDMDEYKDGQYNKLSKALRETLDMKKIYSIMGM